MIVGQGPIALAVSADGGCLDIFSLIYLFSSLSSCLWETVRYSLNYCLKGALNPKQLTNQRLSWMVNLHKFEVVPFKKMKADKKHSVTNLDQFHPMVLEIRVLSFLGLWILITAPGGHLGLSNCIYMKWFHSRTIVIESDQNKFVFLRYWHLSKIGLVNTK